MQLNKYNFNLVLQSDDIVKKSASSLILIQQYQCNVEKKAQNNKTNVEKLTNNYSALQTVAEGISPTKYAGIGLKLLSIISLSLPIKALVPETDLPNSALEKILANKILRVATINDATTYFSEDGFVHGYGYDLARNYAMYLGVNLQVTTYRNEQQAMRAVSDGFADIALTNITQYHLPHNSGLSSVSLECNRGYLGSFGLNSNVSWNFRYADQPLVQNAQAFLCNDSQIAINQQLAAFYTQNVLKDKYSQQHFNRTMTQFLPTYQASFQQNAKDYNHDWQLLVAMGYQESHLKPDAISPTGVQGIMMLTNDTAKEMGVTDRVDPAQSIAGGAKYLEILKKQFSNVPNPDRLWFALASYNMGPAAVKAIQAVLHEQGKNGNSWAEVYRYMAENSSSNSRYVQCIHYVTNIRGYLEMLKLASQDTLQAA